MSTSIPLQLAETLQTAHLKRDPSPRHDLNPSTAASKKEPVHLEPVLADDGGIDDVAAYEMAEEEEEEEEEEDEEEAPYRSRIKPHPRRHHLPPMPDLRFEQSYLWSIRNADTWWKVVWITVRDQVKRDLILPWAGLGWTECADGRNKVMMPFVQGILYNLAICGWQCWKRNAQIHGSSIGARVRRWWYGVNSWPIPAESKAREEVVWEGERCGRGSAVVSTVLEMQDNCGDLLDSSDSVE